MPYTCWLTGPLQCSDYISIAEWGRLVSSHEISRLGSMETTDEIGGGDIINSNLESPHHERLHTPSYATQSIPPL